MSDIKNEFLESWIRMRNFYDDPYTMRIFLGDELANRMVEFVNTLRQEGYDQHLRCGQALHHLIISRSKKHGLRADQPYLCFQPEYWQTQNNGQTQVYESLRVTYCIDSTVLEEIEADQIAVTDQIRQLLKKLLEQEIN